MISEKISAFIAPRRNFIRGSSILALTTLLSYGLGLLRDRVFAVTFGASSALDAYNAAFILPDLILNIFVAGALSAAFLPIFSEISTKDDKEEISRFVSSVLNAALLAVALSGVLIFFLAPWLSNFLVSGFDQGARELYTNMTRLLLLSPLLFAASNTLGNLLLSNERFFWFGISAAIYNLGIILGTLILAPFIGIYGAALGVILGAALHLLSRIIGLRGKFNFSWRLGLFKTASFKKFLSLMAPRMAGHPIEQAIFLGFAVIASTLGAGSITVLTFARNFQSMPVAVIGINFALAAFPVLSRISARGDRSSFSAEFLDKAKMILLATVPAALLLYIFRLPIIDILLGGGAFDKEAVRLTAATLGVFTLAIPTESLSHLLARTFYALKNSLIPLLASVSGLITALGGGFWLASFMGVPGLALGFFLGSLLKTIILLALLKRETARKL